MSQYFFWRSQVRPSACAKGDVCIHSINQNGGGENKGREVDMA